MERFRDFNNISGNTRSNKRKFEEANSKPSDYTRNKKRKEGDGSRKIPPMERMWRESIGVREELERGLRTAKKVDEKVSNYVSKHKDYLDLPWLQNSTIYKEFRTCLENFEKNLGKAEKHLEIGQVGQVKSEDQKKILHKLITSQKSLSEKFDKVQEEVQDEIIIRESIKEGKALPENILRKSNDRIMRGMTKEVINKSLETFYDFSVKRLTSQNKEMKDLREELNDLGYGPVKGNEHDYFYVQMWPQAPDKTKSLKDEPPYRAYINPREGIMIDYQTLREDDQKWRDKNFPEPFPEEWGLESVRKELKLEKLEKLPKEFSEALNASDLHAQLYQIGEKAWAELEGNDAPRSPCKIQERTRHRSGLK